MTYPTSYALERVILPSMCFLCWELHRQLLFIVIIFNLFIKTVQPFINFNINATSSLFNIIRELL
jgi:hypothetical protein